MKPFFLTLTLFLAACVGAFSQETIDPFAKGDLSDWTFDAAHWSFKDGIAVGKTTDDAPLPYNKFLIWNGGELKDFELTCELKMVGNSNSGIQYRSSLNPEAGPDSIKGYQCDVHPNPPYAGMLYEERGRAIVATRGQKVVIMPDGKKLQIGKVGKEGAIDVFAWNTYTIRCEGNHLIHQVNGNTVVEIIDLQEDKRAMSGKLAFQIHRGPAMEAQIKNVKIKTLPAGKILTKDDVAIPADAQEVNGAKPKAK